MDDSVIMCDEVIESYEEAKLFEQILMKRKETIKCKIYITYIFFNYYNIIGSCQYLLLFHKIFVKTKTFIKKKLCIIKSIIKMSNIHKSKNINKISERYRYKNQTNLFFNDIINIKYLDPNNIKIDEKSNKNIPFYYIWYVAIKDSKYIKINSVNPLCLILIKVNVYFEEIIEN